MKFKCSSSTTAPATPDIAADVGTGWAPKVRAEEKFLKKSFRLGCGAGAGPYGRATQNRQVVKAKRNNNFPTK